MEEQTPLLLQRAQELQVLRDYHGALARCFEYLQIVSNESIYGEADGGGGEHWHRCQGRTCACFAGVCQALQLLAACRRHEEIIPFAYGWYGGLDRVPAFILSLCILALAQDSLYDEAEQHMQDWLALHGLCRENSAASRKGDGGPGKSGAGNGNGALSISLAFPMSSMPALYDNTDGMPQLVSSYIQAVLLPTQRYAHASDFLESIAGWMPSETLLELRKEVALAAEKAGQGKQAREGPSTPQCSERKVNHTTRGLLDTPAREAGGKKGEPVPPVHPISSSSSFSISSILVLLRRTVLHIWTYGFSCVRELASDLVAHAKRYPLLIGPVSIIILALFFTFIKLLRGRALVKGKGGGR